MKLKPSLLFLSFFWCTLFSFGQSPLGDTASSVEILNAKNLQVQNLPNGTQLQILAGFSHKEQLVGSHVEYASAEHDEGIEVPENDPVFNALKLIYTQKYFKKSLKLAELVQQQFAGRGRVNRGVKQRNEKGIWVLHATGMPSILVEAGFISNKEEEEYMNSEQGQEEIATDILNAIKAYIASLEAPRTGEAEPVNAGPVSGNK